MIEMQETPESIQKKLNFCFGLVTITFLFSMATLLFPQFNPTDDPQGIWFQRSGSFMVIASIGTEFILVKVAGYLDPYNERFMSFTEMTLSLKSLHYKLSQAVIFLALYGTVVWGYGDLFIKNT